MVAFLIYGDYKKFAPKLVLLADYSYPKDII